MIAILADALLTLHAAAREGPRNRPRAIGDWRTPGKKPPAPGQSRPRRRRRALLKDCELCERRAPITSSRSRCARRASSLASLGTGTIEQTRSQAISVRSSISTSITSVWPAARANPPAGSTIASHEPRHRAAPENEQAKIRRAQPHAL